VDIEQVADRRAGEGLTLLSPAPSRFPVRPTWRSPAARQGSVPTREVGLSSTQR
jgi:hypothetical protein